jgi:hypothetical protein
VRVYESIPPGKNELTWKLESDNLDRMHEDIVLDVGEDVTSVVLGYEFMVANLWIYGYELSLICDLEVIFFVYDQFLCMRRLSSNDLSPPADLA